MEDKVVQISLLLVWEKYKDDIWKEMTVDYEEGLFLLGSITKLQKASRRSG